MTPEQAIQEIKQGAAARLFERRPYFRAVFTAMSPEDQQSTIATIERETNVPECQLSDIDNWLEDRLNQAHDEGKLPEVSRGQQRLQANADQAMREMPMADLKKHLTALNDVAQAELRRQRRSLINDDPDAHIFPG